MGVGLYSPKCVEGNVSEVRQESFKKSPIGRLFRSSQCYCLESITQMQRVRKGGELGESDSPRQLRLT
jgi:hypothetical protein